MSRFIFCTIHFPFTQLYTKISFQTIKQKQNSSTSKQQLFDTFSTKKSNQVAWFH